MQRSDLKGRGKTKRSLEYIKSRLRRHVHGKKMTDSGQVVITEDDPAVPPLGGLAAHIDVSFSLPCRAGIGRDAAWLARVPRVHWSGKGKGEKKRPGTPGWTLRVAPKYRYLHGASTWGGVYHRIPDPGVVLEFDVLLKHVWLSALDSLRPWESRVFYE